jgi:bZIP-type transcription factor MBZ1
MSASTHSQSSTRSSSSASQANCLDPLDALIDFSEYEQVSYQSPSISPASSKPQFVRPVASTPNANNALLSSSQQTLSGPSHNYDLYKQQTGIPSGAIANTLAMNTTNMYNFGYMSGISPGDDFIDFGTAPTQSSSGFDMDLEFESPSTEPAFFFPDHSINSSSEYVNPSVIGGQENQSVQSSVLPSQTSNVGRLWPGMHQQQAALAKAQQQQKQQQQIIQQQRAQNMAQPKQQRTKSHQPTDPIVEEKISQLLNSMRHSSVATSENDDAVTPNASNHSHRTRKEEEEMDEDERLLASEEGKKLSSKERRQLRNKVSARAFRSRRKGKLKHRLRYYLC